MLALAQREVERRGGAVAYCDTDASPWSRRTTAALCPARAGRIAFRTARVDCGPFHGLHVDAIRERFTSLNPYDRGPFPARC